MQTAKETTLATTSASSSDFTATLLRVAWLAILLGLAIQLLLLIVGFVFDTVPGIKPLIADIVNRVSWSFIVCIGLATGTAAARSRPAAMGLAGLLAAPLAFLIARSLHKAVAQALDIGPVPEGSSSALVFAGIKAIEYGWLGMLLGRIGQRLNAGVASYGGAGLATGAIFGGWVLALLYPLALPVMIARGVNEVLFPVGCALVIHAADAIGKRSS